MMHPLFSTLIQRPDLAANHLSAYAQLFQQEASFAGTALMTRVIAWVVAALSALVFLGLAGAAIMLGVLQNQFHWVLVAVPGCALLAMVVALIWARKPVRSEKFPELRAQLDSDIRALRSVA
jgi:ABC-type sugar transport system permease subunit